MAGNLLASPSDLCTRLGKETPDAESPEFKQLEALLSDASGEMRAVIGQTLSRETSTVHLFPDGTEKRRKGGRERVMSYVDLPAIPVISIDALSVDGSTVAEHDYFTRYRTLFLPHVYYDSEVEVTYTHGFDPLPEELVKWTCILAAAAVNAADTTGALGVTAGISQHTQTIDDYTEGWANYSGYKAPGLSVPPEIGQRLKALYGGGGITTVSFR